MCSLLAVNVTTKADTEWLAHFRFESLKNTTFEFLRDPILALHILKS